MKVTVELIDILASYKKYLEDKLGVKFDGMEAYQIDDSKVERPEVPAKELMGKHFIRFQ